MFNKQEADKLIEMIERCDRAIKTIEKDKNDLQEKLLFMLREEVENSLEGKAYGCGTANIETDTKTIKVTIGKKVDWDQDKLKSIWNDIQKGGENPEEYITLKYGVSENAYKSWPSSISDVFEPARTVTPSKPTLKIEEKK